MAFFPDSGVIRDVSLSLVVATIFLLAEFLALLLYQWFKSPRRLDDIRFVWSILVVSFVVLFFSFIVSDFYALSWEREFWVKIGYISALLGITFLAFVAERKLLGTKLLFTSISVGGIILTLLLPHSILKYVSYTFLFPALSMFFVSLLYRLYEKAEEPLKKQVSFFALGFVSFLSGFVLTADAPVQFSKGLSYVFGALLMIVGILSVNFAVLKMPSFGELDWQDKIDELYLISRAGIPLLYINFKSGLNIVGPDQALKAAVISALSLGLEGAGINGKVRMVDQGNLKFLFGYSKSALLVLVVKENLAIIQRKIDEFLKKFNELYGELLESWDGNISIFKPAEILAKNIFTGGSKTGKCNSNKTPLPTRRAQ